MDGYGFIELLTKNRH